VKVPFVDLKAELRDLGDEFEKTITRVCDNGLYILGAEVAAFEREFADYCGVRHCIGVGSGFDALQMIFRASGIGPGDEVIVPAYTAVATWLAVSAVGATPVGVDVDPRTYNLDPSRISAAITPRTKAIVAVPLFGQPANMDAIAAQAARCGLLLFEDAAQAHGARYRGRRTGGLARAAAFSFYPTKNLGALGDAGAVTTDDDELAERVVLLRSYGWRNRSASEVKGFNSRLDELQAAILRIKLNRLERWNSERRARAERYLDELAKIEEVTLPEFPGDVEPVWHVFAIRAEKRAALQEHLAANGIQTLVHYDPLPHLTSAFRDDGWAEGALPQAERLAQRALSLPMFPQLTLSDCDEVISAISSSVTAADGRL